MNCTKKGVMNILGGEDSISLLTLYSALQVNLQLKVLVKTVHPFLNKQCIFSYKCANVYLYTTFFSSMKLLIIK